MVILTACYTFTSEAVIYLSIVTVCKREKDICYYYGFQFDTMFQLCVWLYNGCHSEHGFRPRCWRTGNHRSRVYLSR